MEAVGSIDRRRMKRIEDRASRIDLMALAILLAGPSSNDEPFRRFAVVNPSNIVAEPIPSKGRK